MSFNPPFWLRNNHFQTIYPSLYRRIRNHAFRPEVIDTPDGDFLELDWSLGTQSGDQSKGSNGLVIVSHGLEGNSRRPYVQGMAQAANRLGWDALCWNFRSCGIALNYQLGTYHSGDTQDLHQLVELGVSRGYQRIVLVGFSMGGNKTLKYLGEQGEGGFAELVGGVAFSVPCDLTSSAVQLAKPSNRLYMQKFLGPLGDKLAHKQWHYPESVNLEHYDEIKTFAQFDDRYTAPIHGFVDAYDYWEQSSSKQYVPKIARPTWLISALDDPFLTADCFPHKEAEANLNFRLITTAYGGHVGFMPSLRAERYWSEVQVQHYLQQIPSWV